METASTLAEKLVSRAAGKPLPRLFAGGGAACGISGPHACGRRVKRVAVSSLK